MRLVRNIALFPIAALSALCLTGFAAAQEKSPIVKQAPTQMSSVPISASVSFREKTPFVPHSSRPEQTAASAFAESPLSRQNPAQALAREPVSGGSPLSRENLTLEEMQVYHP